MKGSATAFYYSIDHFSNNQTFTVSHWSANIRIYFIYHNLLSFHLNIWLIFCLALILFNQFFYSDLNAEHFAISLPVMTTTCDCLMYISQWRGRTFRLRLKVTSERKREINGLWWGEMRGIFVLFVLFFSVSPFLLAFSPPQLLACPLCPASSWCVYPVGIRSFSCFSGMADSVLFTLVFCFSFSKHR